MKKIISVMSMVLLLLCLNTTAFAIPYEDAKTISSVEFEDLTDADLGGESEIIQGFDDHYDWGMTEGFATITKGNNGNGLLLTPDYDNPDGFQSCVMRSQMNIVAADKDAWKNAGGFRMWINNTSEYEITVCPILLMKKDDGGDWGLSLNTSIYLLTEDGEYEDIYMDSGVNNGGVIIPYGFTGWLIAPNTIGETDSEAGWQVFPDWCSSSEPVVMEEIDLGEIARFVLDVRCYGLLSGDEGGIILDSIELFGTAGEDIEMPDPSDSKPTVSATPTGNGSVDVTPTATENTVTPPADDNNLTWLYVGIALVAVCIIVVVVIVVSKKKKGANAENDTTKDE